MRSSPCCRGSGGSREASSGSGSALLWQGKAAGVKRAHAGAWSDRFDRPSVGIGARAAARPDGFERVAVHPGHAEDGWSGLAVLVNILQGGTVAIEEGHFS